MRGSIVFFVNGMFVVRGEQYAMRFLAQFSEEDGEAAESAQQKEAAEAEAAAGAAEPRALVLALDVTALDASRPYARRHNVRLRRDAAEPAPTVIEVPVDDGAMGPAVVRRYAYVATLGVHEGGTKEVRGTFALVGELARDELRFGFVSCNDNCAPSAWNAYRAQGRETAWPALGDERVDVLVHCGDQVYADGVYAAARAGASAEMCAARLRELYASTYAEPWQARAMRNALNVAILDDHEVADGYGVARLEPSYYVALALAAYRAYQCDLRANAFDASTESYSFVQRVGKYTLVALDERSPMVRTGVAVDERAVELVAGAARDARRDARELIVVSPRPLVFLDPVCSAVLGAVASDGKDALMHPRNMAGTLRLRDALLHHRALGGRACVVSGDVHCAFVQTHAGALDELVVSGVSRAPLASEPAHVRLVAAAALAAFAACKSMVGVARRSSVAWTANYGVLSSGRLCVRSAPLFGIGILGGSSALGSLGDWRNAL